MSSSLPAPAVGGDVPAARAAPGGLLRGGAVVAFGLAIELGSTFLRALILARMLGATEFGLVVSINALVGIVELVSFIGVDRYIVYAPEGGQQAALDVGHALAVLRAVLSAVMVLALAVPTASLIGEKPYALSFAMVAVVPLLRGAAHLGVVQMQRYGRFWPASAADAGGAVLGVLAATLAASIAPDHRAILWGLVAQTAGAQALTHLFARGIRYRISIDPVRIRQALHFGLPLLANGIALAMASQLDRMVVGARLGVVELGLYGLCNTLLLQPTSLLLRLGTTTLQPPLSAAWHADPLGAFRRLNHHFARYSALVAGAGAATVACIGAPMVRLVFGHSYVPSDGFVALLACVLLFRLGRGALNIIALAIGRTTDLMKSNFIGAAALPVMLGALQFYPRLESAAFGALVGEVLAYIVAHIRLRVHCAEACREFARSYALAAVAPAVLGVWVQLANPTLWMRGVAAGLVLLALGPLALLEYYAPRRQH